jgi:hypothetical protein
MIRRITHNRSTLPSRPNPPAWAWFARSLPPLLSDWLVVEKEVGEGVSGTTTHPFPKHPTWVLGKAGAGNVDGAVGATVVRELAVEETVGDFVAGSAIAVTVTSP